MYNIISPKELYTKDFHLSIHNLLKQNWNINKFFNCIDQPKRTDMFLYIDGFTGKYIFPNGEQMIIPSKSLVYVPKNSRYLFKCLDNTNENIFNSTLINFTLTDTNGNIFLLSDKITFISPTDTDFYETILTKMTKVSYQPLQTPCVMKRYFYQLISRLCEHYHKKELFSERFEIISEGIQYLEENEKLSLSIAEIAKLCNVSEVYFRKLFKEYSGVTPHQFKINAKIRLAKQHLLSDNMTISETASDLGFNEVSYFCEIFKQKTGYTPTEYINKMKKR